VARRLDGQMTGIGVLYGASVSFSLSAALLSAAG